MSKLKKVLSKQIGVITMAYGHQRYLEQAVNLLLSLKYNMPNLPVAVVTDKENELTDLFDFVIPFEPTYGLGVANKVYLNKYTPFKETLFIDSDCIVTRPFESELSKLRDYSFSPVCDRFLTRKDDDDFIEDISFTLDKLGIDKIPKFNGGIYFFKNDLKSKEIFSEAQRFHENFEFIGIKKFDKFGANDETIFSLALGKLNIFDFYDDLGELMRPTINVNGEIEIEPLGGGCSFRPWNVMVAPAICHFVRNNVMDKYYLKCEMILRKEFGLIDTLSDRRRYLLKHFKLKSIYSLKMLYFKKFKA